MDKLKNLLKSDTPTGEESSSSTTSTSRLGGQGSHFPSKDETSAPTGSTVTGTEPSTRGPADVSAVSGSSTAAATTTGPEAGGSSHVGTTSAGQGVTTGAKDYTVSSADFPRTQGSTDGSGTAAVGSTGSNPATKAAGLAFAQGEDRKQDIAGHENPYKTTHLDPRVDGLSKASAEQATSSSTGASYGSGAGAATGVGAGAGLAGAGAASAYNSSSRAHETAPAPSSLTSTADPTSRSAEYGGSTNTRGLDAADTVGTSNTGGSYSTGGSALTETTEAGKDESVVGKVLGAVGLGSVAGAMGYGAASARDSSAVAESPEQPTTTTGLTSYTAPTHQGPPTGHHRKESIPTTAYPSGTLDSVRAINQPLGGAGSPVVHGDRGTGSTVGTGVAASGSHGNGGTEQPDTSGLTTAHHATTLGGDSTTTHATTAPGQSHTARDTALGAGAGAAVVGAGAYGAHEYGSRDVGKATTGATSTGTTGASVGDVLTTSPTGANKTGATSDATTAGAYSGPAPTTAGSGTAHTTTMPEQTVGTGAHGFSGRDIGQPGEQSYSSTTATTADEKDHTARNTAIGAGAGAAAAGAGAYGAHEYSKREAEKAETEAAKEQAAREKELARQRAHEEKELEKQHKAEEKAAAKEEKHHQKELEKEEKKHQKEVEKEEKQHQKEVEKREAEQQRQLEKEAEERRKREEREKLAAGAAVGGAGATTAEHEREKEKEKEKKPSLFRRIFKRRKNDKGEEEEYSSDEEVPHHSNTPAAAAYGTALVAGGGAATYEAERRKSSTAGAGASKYEQVSGGAQKPSYNPLSKDKEVSTTATGQTPSSANTYGSTAGLTEAVTGTPSYPEAYRETKGVGDNVHVPGTLTHDNKLDSTGTTSATGATTTTTAGTTGTSGSLQKDSITGLPFDPSKDPEAASRLMQHTHGEGIGTYDPKDTAPPGTGPTVVTAVPIEGHDKGIAPSTLESTGVASSQPTEAVTGTTTSKSYGSTAPGTVESTGTHTQQPAGAVTGLPHGSNTTGYGTTGTTTSTGEFKPPTDFTLGEVKDSKR